MVKKTKADKMFDEIDKSYQKAIEKCDRDYHKTKKKSQNRACVVGALSVAITLDKYKLARIK